MLRKIGSRQTQVIEGNLVLRNERKYIHFIHLQGPEIVTKVNQLGSNTIWTRTQVVRFYTTNLLSKLPKLFNY